jgi:hypothetical protein
VAPHGFGSLSSPGPATTAGCDPTRPHACPPARRNRYAGPNTLVATIENSLAAAERNMIELDEHHRVREVRMFFQHASERDFVETVEQITGREVRAFVSGIDTKHDVSSEVFYFEPVATG